MAARPVTVRGETHLAKLMRQEDEKVQQAYLAAQAAKKEKNSRGGKKKKRAAAKQFLQRMAVDVEQRNTLAAELAKQPASVQLAEWKLQRPKQASGQRAKDKAAADFLARHQADAERRKAELDAHERGGTGAPPSKVFVVHRTKLLAPASFKEPNLRQVGELEAGDAVGLTGKSLVHKGRVLAETARGDGSWLLLRRLSRAESTVVFVRNAASRCAELLGGVHGPYAAVDAVIPVLAKLGSRKLHSLATAVVQRWCGHLGASEEQELGGALGLNTSARLLSLPAPPAAAATAQMVRWLGAMGEGLDEAARRHLPFVLLGKAIPTDHPIFRSRRHAVGDLAEVHGPQLVEEFAQMLGAAVKRNGGGGGGGPKGGAELRIGQQGHGTPSTAGTPAKTPRKGDSTTEGEKEDDEYGDDEDFEDDFEDDDGDGDDTAAAAADDAGTDKQQQASSSGAGSSSSSSSSGAGGNFFARFEAGLIGRGALSAGSNSVHPSRERVEAELRAEETFKPALNQRSRKLAWGANGLHDDVTTRQVTDAQRRLEGQRRRARAAAASEAAASSVLPTPPPSDGPSDTAAAGVADGDGNSGGGGDDTAANDNGEGAGEAVQQQQYPDGAAGSAAARADYLAQTERYYLRERPVAGDGNRTLRLEVSAGAELAGVGGIGVRSTVLSVEGRQTIGELALMAAVDLAPSSAAEAWTLVRGAGEVLDAGLSAAQCGLLPEMRLRLVRADELGLVGAEGAAKRMAASLKEREVWARKQAALDARHERRQEEAEARRRHKAAVKEEEAAEAEAARHERAQALVDRQVPLSAAAAQFAARATQDLEARRQHEVYRLLATETAVKHAARGRKAQAVPEGVLGSTDGDGSSGGGGGTAATTRAAQLKQAATAQALAARRRRSPSVGRDAPPMGPGSPPKIRPRGNRAASLRQSKGHERRTSPPPRQRPPSQQPPPQPPQQVVGGGGGGYISGAASSSSAPSSATFARGLADAQAKRTTTTNTTTTTTNTNTTSAKRHNKSRQQHGTSVPAGYMRRKAPGPGFRWTDTGTGSEFGPNLSRRTGAGDDDDDGDDITRTLQTEAAAYRSDPKRLAVHHGNGLHKMVLRDGALFPVAAVRAA